ncbi:inorganic diphosphatase [Candidatus Falkowbacteria bacterium]|nr:inorganic diphosphatase [Candidatus Falkowbacteria bacterium]
MNLKNIPLHEQYPEKLNVVIEIPKGSSNKYEVTEDGIIALDRVLHSPFFYPADYGFVPGTLAEDGDPVDVLVVTDSPCFPGCLVEARPIGILYMEDDKGKDEKVIAVQTKNPRYKHINDVADLGEHIVKEFDHFFSEYKKLEGKWAKTAGHAGKDAAIEYLKKQLDK